jgi:hypothetical protein
MKKFEKVYRVLEHELKAVSRTCSIFVCPVEFDLSACRDLVPEAPKESDDIETGGSEKGMITNYGEWEKPIKETIRKWGQALKYSQRRQMQRALDCIESPCPLCEVVRPRADGCNACIVYDYIEQDCKDRVYDVTYCAKNCKDLSKKIEAVIRELEEMLTHTFLGEYNR